MTKTLNPCYLSISQAASSALHPSFMHLLFLFPFTCLCSPPTMFSTALSHQILYAGCSSAPVVAQPVWLLLEPCGRHEVMMQRCASLFTNTQYALPIFSPFHLLSPVCGWVNEFFAGDFSPCALAALHSLDGRFHEVTSAFKNVQTPHFMLMCTSMASLVFFV